MLEGNGEGGGVTAKRSPHLIVISGGGDPLLECFKFKKVTMLECWLLVVVTFLH